MFLAVRQIGPVDQPLDQVIAVIGRGISVEDNLVAFGKETMIGAGFGTELDGHGVRILLGRGLADPHVAEVAVFEQADRVSQLALRVQAQRRDDLARGQAEQPDPAPVTVAACCQRWNLSVPVSSASRLKTRGNWSPDSR